MGRLIGALAAVLYLLSPAGAITAPAHAPQFRPGVEAIRPAAPAPTQHTPAAGEFILTTDSEVILDDRSCAYKAVPAGAAVLRIEVGPDRKTIRRIEFRSPR